MSSIPNAPDGYVITPGPPEDLEELVALIGSAQLKYEGVVAVTASFWRALVADPQVDPIPNYLQIRSAGTGELAGFGRYSNLPPHVESRTQGSVHPDHEGKGIGSYIVEWGVERSDTLIDEAPPRSRVTNVVAADVNNRGASRLFAHNGYAVSRYFLEMERVFDGPVNVEDLPDDVAVRTMRGAEDIEVIVDPISEAFRDHYGHTEATRQAEIEEWHRWRSTDEWDDSLVWIVEASGVAVAVNVCISSFGARKETGYVASLGVVGDWRGRGIARALLTTSFAEFQRRGRRAVALHVDGDSLTGAKRLYERVGMSESQRQVEFSREIRPGTDVVVR